MTTHDIERRIMRFLETDLLVDLPADLAPDTDLFKAGLIASVDYLRIIKFLRADLGVPITDDDLFTNVFVSISGITHYAARKLAAGA